MDGHETPLAARKRLAVQNRRAGMVLVRAGPDQPLPVDAAVVYAAVDGRGLGDFDHDGLGRFRTGTQPQMLRQQAKNAPVG